jgi:hypothetical protein
MYSSQTLKTTWSDWLGSARKGRIIRNQTARRIAIDARPEGGVPTVIPPFGERVYDEDVHEAYDTGRWERMGLIEVKSEERPEKTEFDVALLGIGALLLLLKLVIPAWRANHWFWLFLFGPIVCGRLIIYLYKRRKEVSQHVRHAIILFFVMLIGLALPGIVIYFFGGVSQLVALGYDGSALPVQLLGRGLQLAFIVVASLTPCLLYFLFDRQQLTTLRESFFHDIIALDPRVTTVSCAKARYGKRIEEVYGPETDSESWGRLPHITCAPILGTTLVITLGWIIVLAPFGRISPVIVGSTVHKLLLPQPTAVNFGFLGAYFFAINMILRRYSRADLKPKAYSHITVRILGVVVLAWVISVLFLGFKEGGLNLAATDTHAGLLIVAFLVGIVPETGVAVIVEYVRSLKPLMKLFPSLREEHPLDRLEGIGLYDRARLLEEGIENIENLVNHDIIDLMLETRIPVPRLVDWIDQGILYMHAVELSEPEAAAGSDIEAESTLAMSSLKQLHRFGIRTATDLQEAHNAALARDKKAVTEGKPAMELGGLLSILGESEKGVKRLQVILDTLSNDEWLSHVWSWREHGRSKDKIYTIDDFYRELRGLTASVQPAGLPAEAA